MNIQTIQALDGRQYVLLPLETYAKIKDEIDNLMDDDSIPFVLSDYVDNPIALVRIEARVTQMDLGAPARNCQKSAKSEITYIASAIPIQSKKPSFSLPNKLSQKTSNNSLF